MGLIERNKFSLVVIVLVGTIFVGKGTCDSICPNGITNITAAKGVIEYPESGNYGINETKCWRIEVPETYEGIYWYYSRFDIEECKYCECDSLESASYYSTGLLSSGECGRLSDEYLEYLRRQGDPKDTRTTRNTIYFRFASDETVHRKGFKLSFIAYSDRGGAASYLNATEDETIEFGTPKVGFQNYPAGFAQQWFLIVPEGKQVHINFDVFELEKSEDCKNDYVEFREAYFDDNDPTDIEGYRGPILTRRLCGSSKPSTIQSSGNMVWVQFKSDYNSTTVYKGFKASFKAGQAGILSASNPLMLLILSALLMIASKNSVF
ncbi:hypothetical protein ACROYT_G019865 [Oculina patagonica]